MLWRRLKGRRGQSIVEYLVIVTVVIAAILLIRGKVSTNMNTLFNKAAGHTATAGTKLGALTPE